MSEVGTPNPVKSKDFKLGTLMRKWRDRKGISQRDIAGRLGYKNINFISMLERGGSTIPIARIPDVVKAYELPAEMGIVMAMTVAPDVWKTWATLHEQMIGGRELHSAVKKCEVLYQALMDALAIK